MRLPAQPAAPPYTLPTGTHLPEWDRSWSRIVTVDTADGPRTFHVLDTLSALTAAGVQPAGTIVAVHGNPTWSYLWRRLAALSVERAVAGQGRAWRLIAPDQLEMGYSERLAHAALPTPRGDGYRRLADRITDLDALVAKLLPESTEESSAVQTRAGAGAGANLPVANSADHTLVTLGHDWGGVISLGWAARNPDRVDAVMSCNTAVHHPQDQPIPAPLRAALAGDLLPTSTVRTDAFLRVSLSLSNTMNKATREAFRSPYQHRRSRGGIGAFVADIPVDETHPSYPELQRIGADIAAYPKPALLLWGPKDPVFLERYLRDLKQRLPQADLHRFERTSHLFMEDTPYARVAMDWLERQFPVAEAAAADSSPSATGRRAADSVPTHSNHRVDEFSPVSESESDKTQPLDKGGQKDSDVAAQVDDPPFIFDQLDARAHDRTIASVDMSVKPAQSVTWAQLSGVVDGIARGLHKLGLKRGDRVSLLITPGNDLTAAAYAVLKAGGVAVVADAGLGPAGMTRAVKSADPQWIIGETPGLSLARGGNWPGRRISVKPMGWAARRALDVESSITELSRTPKPHTRASATTATHAEHHNPRLDDDAAILFTSGSTGPAKGVRYTHRRLGNLVRLLSEQFDVRPGSGLVAGFAPFALFGPGIGATSVTPDMSVTKPRTLTAKALADAIKATECTMVFASPAAWTNVVATKGSLDLAGLKACAGIDLVLSAGAPVPLELMNQLADLFPNAAIHSPYGMTEGLLLTDIDRAGVTAAADSSHDHGVCVGTPITGVQLALAPLDDNGVPAETLLHGTHAHGALGEFVVSAGHIKAGYDNLWKTDAESKRDTDYGLTWHRTNDIGHIDASGRVWLEGRVQHVISGPAGPIGPGGVEAVVDKIADVARSAAVGVGPAGTQALVIVLERNPKAESTDLVDPGLAPLEMADRVRSTVARELGHDVAAVLVAPKFPTDIRHNSKIDRGLLGRWAAGVLTGAPVRRWPE